MYSTRLVCHALTHVLPVCLSRVDAEASWDSAVRGPAQEITDGGSNSLVEAVHISEVTAAFLNNSDLPNPLSLSDTARDLLTEKPKRLHQALRRIYMLLTACDSAPRRKMTCEVCTLDKDRPFMLDEGPQWKAHLRTRHHRKRAVKAQLRKLQESHDTEQADEVSDTSQALLYETNALYT